MTPDVYSASAHLEAGGVKFHKRPDEGRMKGIAFALDPDGYWIEIVKRSPESSVRNTFTLAQTMVRVKDPAKSLHFYCGRCTLHFPASSVGLSCLPPCPCRSSGHDAPAHISPRRLFPVLLGAPEHRGGRAIPAAGRREQRRGVYCPQVRAGARAYAQPRHRERPTV